MARARGNIPRLPSKLNEFRESGRYCDVTTIIGDERFKWHRLVLAATSESFDTKFGAGRFRERDAANVILHEIGAAAFAEMLEFAHAGLEQDDQWKSVPLNRGDNEFLRVAWRSRHHPRGMSGVYPTK